MKGIVACLVGLRCAKPYTAQSKAEMIAKGLLKKLWRQPPNHDKFVKAIEEGDTESTESLPFPIGVNNVNYRTKNFVRIKFNAWLLPDQQKQDPPGVAAIPAWT